MKTYIEKISELIIKGRIRLCQLSGTDPTEIVVPFTNAEMALLWVENEHWQRAFFWERLTTNISVFVRVLLL